ncbi:MAG: hypothetical protein M9948_01215 [Lentimicrobium sp.]|nr:hypothetical protein [Lentimicrobium sp.]
MKKKTITMRWLGAILVGVMLTSGIGLSAFAQSKVRRAPADPATFEKIPANRLNAGTFTVNRATGEAVDISVTVDFFYGEDPGIYGAMISCSIRLSI